MMHESKGHILAKPHPYIFSHYMQLVHEKILGNYLITTYRAHIPIQLMHCIIMPLDHINLVGHVG